MRNSPARIWAALRTSLLKSPRIRSVPILPISPPTRRRIAKVSAEETSARRHRTGQDRGRGSRRGSLSSGFENVARSSFRVQQAALAAFLELATQVGDE